MSSDPKQIKKLYYSIGEVSRMTDLKAYVLRYWETEFKQLKPPKNRAGNRTYRQSDIDLILFIKDLLYNKKFTIEGARTQIASMDEGIDSKEKVEKEVPVKAASVNKENLVKIKQELEKLLELLRK
ncbi:MAG: transcriptional regulator [Candidatus Marinimicrobia bacterium]|jgi:DNA-binding transcriptional MerR regulator|nr:transcriptional regulator [Candidatus Neomarinimicrobiota bacterium]MBS00575.1 transcriptional regulator [Candidatus Neomarinimicrobiota bacterium]MED5266062.1 MerR family transcriptional regulator [Candidatus Neomarinimicrobiota bacterium]|tara:strand:+ start:257 stop:634 length:378 start_codon:yes stop_codon:yes gene_type:complete